MDAPIGPIGASRPETRGDVAYSITIETVTPRILAVVRCHIAMSQIAANVRPALDQVWAFLARNPGLRSDGHNIFLYHHASGEPVTGMDVDFGVEVTRRFANEDRIICVETPGGRAAVVVHRGAYTGIGAAHKALHDWCRASGHRIGLWSWEIYGDHDDDPSRLETTIVYQLT